MSWRIIISSIVITLVSVCIFRAVVIYKSPSGSQTCTSIPGHRKLTLDEGALNRFKGALNIPTVSYKMHSYEPERLLELIEYIRVNFPEIHNSEFIKRELVANYTLIYTIEGTNKLLKPYMLTSHLDVVPVVSDKWSSDPFKSVIKEDKNIYARGTIDAKHLLMAILESLETMIKQGFRPNRSFYLVFGHDEEVGGVEGANTVSKILPKRMAEKNWDKLEYILDEGNIISRSPVLGITGPVALVGVAEKGYVTVRLSTSGSVGHGSMPSPLTAISKLAKAVSKFNSHVYPSMFGKSVEREMLDVFAFHATWPYKLVYANVWLFGPIFEWLFSRDPAMNSLIRTSTAVTMISGGSKENVLPDSASAIINHRVHQLQTIEEVLEYDKKLVNDPSIEVEIQGHYNQPTPTSPYDAESLGYQLIKQSVQQVYPGSIVVPSIFLAASDSKWYVNMTDSIYRFSAIAVPLDEMNRFHGHDERISLENYENLLNFYNHLILNSDKAGLDSSHESREEL